jgi:hypothetical protein
MIVSDFPMYGPPVTALQPTRFPSRVNSSILCGEEPIYGLGGNVAEWVLTRDGKGKVIGGSADCPADTKANCTAAAEYVGFRVVRGAAKPAAQAP